MNRHASRALNVRPRVAFPEIGDYTRVFEEMLRSLDVDVIRGELNDKAINFGVQHSQVMMCYPYKVTLGYLADALDKGASRIVHFSSCGRCRYRHYWKLQEQTLRELGYDFDIIPLKGRSILRGLKRVNPRVSYARIISTIHNAWNEINELESSRAEYDRFIDGRDINILLFGEIFTVLDARANLDVVSRLARLGAKPKYALSMSHYIRDGVTRKKDEYFRKASKYVDGPTGGHGIHSIASVLKAAEEGFDAVIHILPMSCSPEILVQPVIGTLCRENGLPLLTVECDENNSELNMETRLETFVELIRRRKEVGKNGKRGLPGH